MNTFGSLFAGVGGFDRGMENAGWQCRWQVEWDTNCQRVLTKHWPDVPKWFDVCDVKGMDLPPVDCVTFGSPCQDLSVAGKRAGLGGSRSSLFHEAIRIIKEMRDATNQIYPRAAIWENVPGALTSNQGEDFRIVLQEMGDVGAHVLEWAVLDARFFGVPQRRRRVFVVAIFDPATASRSADPLLPVTESGTRHLAKSKQPWKATAATSPRCARTGRNVIGTLTAADLSHGQTSHQAVTAHLLQVVGGAD